MHIKKEAIKNIDYAISKIDAVNAFLMQQTDEKYSFEEELKMLFDIFSDYDTFEKAE